MKLWQKISLLTAAILLISMVVYGGITVYETSNYNIRQTSSAASRQVRATAYALGQSLENAATEEMSDTARKAYLQFCCADTAAEITCCFRTGSLQLIPRISS